MLRLAATRPRDRVVGSYFAISDALASQTLREDTMTRDASRLLLIAGGGLALVAFAAPAAAQSNSVPNLQPDPGGWTHPFGGSFPPVPGSALPVGHDPGHVYLNPVASYKFGDLSNPNLKPWVKEAMKKDIEEIDGGKIQFTPNSSCLPTGVPAFMLMPGPFFILQTPTKVVMIEEQTYKSRHIYLNVPHSANPKPSYNGESIGYYQGDSLVVDTIGFNTKTMTDSFRTPHTEKLHVMERWHTIEDGYTLEAEITVEDPDTFYHPWKTYQRYQRGRRPIVEFICAENNTNLFDYRMPTANKPDF
jgi:hypothetical protein